MLHKVYDFFGWKRDETIEELEEGNLKFVDKLIEDNKILMKDNVKLMKDNKELKKEKEIPPLKVSLRSSRKKRPWCWGLLMVLMAFIQVIAMGNGQKTARRHLIAILKELEYFYGFRFLAIENEEESDERKG